MQPLAQLLQKHLFGTTNVLQPCAFDSEHSIPSFSYAVKGFSLDAVGQRVQNQQCVGDVAAKLSTVIPMGFD